MNATVPSSPSTAVRDNNTSQDVVEDRSESVVSSILEEQDDLEEKIDKLMNRIHGKGRFSCFAFFALVLGMNSTGFFFYILTYLTLLPKYVNCVYKDPQPEDLDAACIADNICSGEVISYDIDWNDIYSLHNWVEKLDLTCCPGWKIGMMGSVIFIGWFITLPWLPRLSDKYGRK